MKLHNIMIIIAILALSIILFARKKTLLGALFLTAGSGLGYATNSDIRKKFKKVGKKIKKVGKKFKKTGGKKHLVPQPRTELEKNMLGSLTTENGGFFIVQNNDVYNVTDGGITIPISDLDNVENFFDVKYYERELLPYDISYDGFILSHDLYLGPFLVNFDKYKTDLERYLSARNDEEIMNDFAKLERDDLKLFVIRNMLKPISRTGLLIRMFDELKTVDGMCDCLFNNKIIKEEVIRNSIIYQLSLSKLLLLTTGPMVAEDLYQLAKNIPENNKKILSRELANSYRGWIDLRAPMKYVLLNMPHEVNQASEHVYDFAIAQTAVDADIGTEGKMADEEIDKLDEMHRKFIHKIE